jgi:nitroimidazol reductase NimA-like FMN-containing flavoprotein (pyridoxamine 5'-phosphate oxidase superfamily)
VATDRTTVRRLPTRGHYDRATADPILDEALVCHVGVEADHGVVVLPTLFVRVADELVLHGAPANALLRGIASGRAGCCTVTLVDGLVMARSAFHHSVNYRSVVVFGPVREVDDPGEKLAFLLALVEKVMTGRTAEARPPSPSELRATRIVAMAIDDLSVKIRTGGPVDEEEDLGLPVWAGVLPFTVVQGDPVPDPALPDGAVPPVLVEGRWRSATAPA